MHILLDYEHARLPEVLARIRPHAALLPSTVSETFSYTLDELMRLAIPPIATRLGAYAERIVDSVDGVLVDADAASVLRCIAELDRDRPRLQNIREQLLRLPQRALARRCSTTMLRCCLQGVARGIALSAGDGRESSRCNRRCWRTRSPTTNCA